MDKIELNEIRGALGITQQQLADKIGYSLRIVQHWSSGRKMSRRAEKAIRKLRRKK